MLPTYRSLQQGGYRLMHANSQTLNPAGSSVLLTALLSGLLLVEFSLSVGHVVTLSLVCTWSLVRSALSHSRWLGCVTTVFCDVGWSY